MKTQNVNWSPSSGVSAPDSALPPGYTCGVSGSALVYSDPIDLTRKWIDGKNLSLFLDINGARFLDVAVAVASRSGGTYSLVYASSGSTYHLASGSSVGGIAANGSYFIPLTTLLPNFRQSNSGVTVYEWLKSVPYIKIGTRAIGGLTTYIMDLVAG